MPGKTASIALVRKNKNLPAYMLALGDYVYNQVSNDYYMLIELFPGE